MTTATAPRAASHESGPEPALLRHYFYEMLRIRMVEEEIAARYGEQKMRCPVHLSIGQEAVAVGASASLRRRDRVVSNHRCHAHYLAKGGDLKAMLAELYGKAAGCCGGRGGSMHLFDDTAGVLLSLPIVGSSIAVGVGAAYGLMQQGEDAVCVIYLGDAALEEGVYHESANFAALHRIPAIFLCENNLYSVYTHLAQRQPARPLEALGEAHGLPSRRVDGNDPAAVHSAVSDAIARGRAGGGPSFVLAETYRWREHCGPNFDNDIGYRDEMEFLAWQGEDPISRTRRRLAEQTGFEAADEAALADDIRAEIEDAFAFAEAAHLPAGETAGDGVYA